MAIANTNAIIVPAPNEEEAEATNALVAEGLRDIRDPVYIAPSYTWLWILLGVLALTALLVWLWRRYARNKAMEAPRKKKTPPYRIALDALREVLQLIHDPEPFCTKVSGILRNYLEGQFELRAPERTTEEFLHELAESDRLDTSQKLSLGRFLEQCDLVKFAKYEPSETELRELHSAALRLVEETMPAGRQSEIEA